MIAKKKLPVLIAGLGFTLLVTGCGSVLATPGALIKPPAAAYVASDVNQTVLDEVNKHLPKGAKLVDPSEPAGSKAVQTVDMNGDGKDEIVATYRTVEEDGTDGPAGILILSDALSSYKELINYKSEGYSVKFIKIAAITEKDKKDIVVAWSIGASIGNGVDTLTMKNDKVEKIASVYANKLDIEDLPDVKGQKDGIDEIAFWQHDTGDAYVIDVVRWNGEKFVSVPAVYPEYFKTVVPFYQEKVKEMPDAAFYWYYLADAQLKAEYYKDAIISAGKGMAILENHPDYYPKVDKFKEIETKASELSEK